MSRANVPWFLSSAVLVAISQAFVYASLAVAPLMVVTPILQLSLVFRLFLSQCINRDYEVMNTAVIAGALTAVLGSILVSLPTDELAKVLGLSPTIADFLRYRLAGADRLTDRTGGSASARRTGPRPRRWRRAGRRR